MTTRQRVVATLGTTAGGVALASWIWRERNARQARDVARHTSQTATEYEDAAHRVLIVGAGFGGLMVARDLDRLIGADQGVSVLVVDRNNSMLFTPLLWIVADGRADPNTVVVPIRDFQRGRRFHVLQAAVDAIDLERRVVTTSAGERHYDSLVLALGSHTALPDLPGVREHARIFGTPANAVELRNRLIDAVEAAHNALDPEERREWLTFVISGGGDTGIELAAVISTYLRGGLFREYPWLANAPVRVVVVGRANRLVPMSEPVTSEAVRGELEREGVEVLTGVSVTGVTERAVQTSHGAIPARTLFWAAGITAPAVVRSLPVAHGPNGALLVDEKLRLPDHPEVSVVGDCAWAFDAVTGMPLPPTAQAAEHMGAYVAQRIGNTLAGRESPPFHFVTRGHLALLGRRTGVGRVGRVVVTGMPAWLLWHAYYLSHIPSWRNRARLILDLLLSAIAGRETGELRLTTDGRMLATQQSPRAASGSPDVASNVASNVTGASQDGRQAPSIGRETERTDAWSARP